LLRLEKGHVIISQDTDGMTHPGEIDMGWAVSRTKPFFVGRRSVDILEAQPQKRKLVGFTLPKTSPQPLEGHLVLRGPDISGNVTSCSTRNPWTRSSAWPTPRSIRASQGSRFRFGWRAA
jgi:sarcosine oxidase subunit alpha